MKKEELKITRYEVKSVSEKYLVYLIPEDDVLSFYIEKVGYGDLYHTVGIPLNNIPEDMEDFINRNINEWISIADNNSID